MSGESNSKAKPKAATSRKDNSIISNSLTPNSRAKSEATKARPRRQSAISQPQQDGEVPKNPKRAIATKAGDSSKRKSLRPTEDSKKTIQANDESALIRLNVYLQEHGLASRRKADTLIEQGRVQVNGEVITTLGTRIARDADVKLNGKALGPLNSKKVVYMLHKPDLCLTSRSDPQGRQTIFNLHPLAKLGGSVQSVGRLDYRSEGLLLLTNDGDLAYALTHPKFSVEKKYAVLIAETVDAEDLDKLRKGVRLDDGMAKPLAVRLGNKEKLGASRGQWVEIVVAEGRNRLIRRMMEAIGLKVLRLVRIGVGDLALPDKLSPGEIMPVVGMELAYLNRIKLDMLDEKVKKPALDLSEEEKRVRRLRKKLPLNDAEYQEEQDRRSATIIEKRKVRRSQKEEKEALAGRVTEQDSDDDSAPSRIRPQNTRGKIIPVEKAPSKPAKPSRIVKATEDAAPEKKKSIRTNSVASKTTNTRSNKVRK